MTVARSTQVNVDSTAYYHCISRCVRRAYLCGDDPLTGKSFDHRKAWVVERMKFLSAVFAVDICAYAVMSNHFHLVVRIGRDRARAWSDEEVLRRAGQLLRKGRAPLGESLTAQERKKLAAVWRQRLWDLSWFMRSLNESIARRANREDECKGRFWEGRFRSQALLDEGALLTCMSYVDLNPVRAKVARTLQDSDFTSIQERLFADGQARKGPQERTAADSQRKKGKPVKSQPSKKKPRAPLVPFWLGEAQGPHTALGGGAPPSEPLPFRWEDYLALVTWTGQAIRDDKAGALPKDLAPIVAAQGLNEQTFVSSVQRYAKTFFSMVGHVHRIEIEGAQRQQKWVKGVRAAKALYRTPERAAA